MAALIALACESESSPQGSTFTIQNDSPFLLLYDTSSSNCAETKTALAGRDWQVVKFGERTQYMSSASSTECLIVATPDLKRFAFAEFQGGGEYRVSTSGSELVMVLTGLADGDGGDSEDSGTSAVFVILVILPAAIAALITLRYFYLYYVRHSYDRKP